MSADRRDITSRHAAGDWTKSTTQRSVRQVSSTQGLSSASSLAGIQLIVSSELKYAWWNNHGFTVFISSTLRTNEHKATAPH